MKKKKHFLSNLHRTAFLAVLLTSIFLSPQARASADLSGLSSDDWQSIETACIMERTNGPVAYNNCVQNQLKSLGNGRAADLSGLSSDDRQSIETACIMERTSGPVAYNNCVQNQLIEVRKL
jgi:hypothetical protein